VDYWSNFRCCKGVPLFIAIVSAASPEFSNANLVYINYKNVPLSCGVKHISIFRIVKAWLTSVTDGRTDRQTVRLWHNIMSDLTRLRDKKMWTAEGGCARCRRSMMATAVKESFDRNDQRSISVTS